MAPRPACMGPGFGISEPAGRPEAQGKWPRPPPYRHCSQDPPHFRPGLDKGNTHGPRPPAQPGRGVSGRGQSSIPPDASQGLQLRRRPPWSTHAAQLVPPLQQHLIRARLRLWSRPTATGAKGTDVAGLR